MLLAIDVGNTNTVVGVFSGEELVADWRMATEHHKMPDEWAALLITLMGHRGYKLADIDAPTAPFGLFETQGQPRRLEEARQVLDEQLSARVREQARRYGASAARIFHAGWALVAAHAAGREDVVYGTVVATAREASSQSRAALGMFVNTLPLRLRLSGVSARQIVEITDRTTPTEVPLRVWKTGAISGSVVDEQGDAVVGVPVTAFRSVTNGAGPVLRDGVATVKTDDRGVYRLAQLEPGRYVVAVLSSSLSLPAPLAAAIDETASNRAESSTLRSALLKGGLLPTLTGEGQRVSDFVLRRPGPPPVVSRDGTLLTYATTFYPGAVGLADTAVIMLGSGEARTGIDVALRFIPTVEVSGVVTGPNGPMNGLTVELVPPTGATTSVWSLEPRGGLLVSTMEPMGSPRAITDAGGAFRFLAVPPGPYVLRAEFIEQARPDSGNADVSLHARQPLSVGEAGVSGLTVALTTGARVSGRVEFRGAAASPLANGRRLPVGLRPVGADLWRNLPGPVAPDGSFTTAGYLPGRYLVFTSDPPGWTLESVSRGGQLVPDDMIELTTEDVTGLVLTFSKTPTRLSGSIADANGAPDPNADVVVFPADATLWREGVIHNRRARMMRATSTGTFEAFGLAPGEYYLAAISAGSMTDWQDPSFLERIVPVAMKITLGSGEEKTVALKTVTPRER